MAQEQIPVKLLALNESSYSWQINGLSYIFDDAHYIKAAVFDRPFTNATSTTPLGLISEQTPNLDYPYNSTVSQSVDGMTPGKTYVVYGGLLTPSGQWWTTTPASSSVTLPQTITKNTDFKTVTWQTPQNPTGKPWGQNYLEDTVARDKWGRYGLDGQKHHLWGFYNSSETDPDKLIHETWTELQKNLEPIVRYTVSIVDLDKIIGRESEPLRLGDTITIIDRDLNLTLKARILEKNVDLNNRDKSTYILGSSYETVSGTMASQPTPPRSYADFVKQGDPISSDWLEGKIDTLKNQINAGGGTVTITDDDGILIVDPKNPNNALKLEGGILALANSRNPDGTYNWRAFGTGAGFTADEINTGVLNGILINGVTITGSQINGVTIEGSTIKSGTNIDVGTDINIGKNINMKMDETAAKSINFGNNNVSITVSPTGTVKISAPRVDIVDGYVNIGAAGLRVNCFGTWDFSSANVQGLPAPPPVLP